jgi:hypothetical protein
MFVAMASRRGSHVVAAVERVVGLLVASAAVLSLWGYGAGLPARSRGPPSLVCLPGSGLHRFSEGSGIMSRDASRARVASASRWMRRATNSSLRLVG